MGALLTTLPQVTVQLRQSYSGKFTSCMTFDAHKHVRSEPFFTTFTQFDTWCWRYLATCEKNCVGAHLHSRPYKPMRWNFIKIFLVSICSGAHNLSADFLDFSQF